MDIAKLKIAFEDTFTDGKLAERTLDSKAQLRNGEGMPMSLYLGSFILFLGKVSSFKKNEYLSIRDWFIDETLNLISGTPEIEPELSHNQYENIELLRKITNLYDIPNIIVK